VSVVRDLHRADLPQLLRLYDEHLHASDDPRPPADRVEALWDAIEADPALHYFGAFEGERLLASCNAAVVPNLTRGCRPWAVIENVVCHADHRRRGLASAVLRAALERCREAGAYKVMLMSAAHRGESVHAFYEAVGFDKHAKQAFLWRPPADGGG